MKLLRLAHSNLVINNIAWSIIIIVLGYLGAKHNPYMHLDIGLLISISTAFLLNRAMMSSLRDITSPSLIRRFITGVSWGVLSGVGLGLVWGWGGGISERGLFLWLTLWVLIWGIALGFTAQMMTYPFPMKRFGVGLSILIILNIISLLYIVIFFFNEWISRE